MRWIFCEFGRDCAYGGRGRCWRDHKRSLSVKLEPRDAWVGLFWDKRRDGLHVYVCPVPFVVFHWHAGV